VIRPKKIKAVRGMTLIEVMIASLIVGVVAMTTMLMMSYARVQARKAADRSTMLDFAYHYLELARALPYDNILPGQPINMLYDGSRQILLPDGSRTTINIRFPTNPSAWQSLTTNDFRFFHPPLVRMAGREPQYRVQINTETTGGLNRARRIRLETRWRAPLLMSVGAWQTLDMDTVVYPEFN
jgi:prepilin-type N-terminal cleavage/methylation domain-containing protein